MFFLKVLLVGYVFLMVILGECDFLSVMLGGCCFGRVILGVFVVFTWDDVRWLCFS